MPYPIKIPSQLRPILLGFRKEAGLTQTAMAQKLGITQQSYAALEANPETASFERIFKVLRLLNVEVILQSAITQPESGAMQGGDDSDDQRGSW